MPAALWAGGVVWCRSYESWPGPGSSSHSLNRLSSLGLSLLISEMRRLDQSVFTNVTSGSMILVPLNLGEKKKKNTKGSRNITSKLQGEERA